MPRAEGWVLYARAVMPQCLEKVNLYFCSRASPSIKIDQS